MFVDIKNRNYGYCVSTYGDYVIVSNPNFFRWDNATSSIVYTGSIDLFRYNKNTDNHDYIQTIYKRFSDINVILQTEIPDELITDPTEYNILIDKDRYTSSLEDSFGISIDTYNKFLIVGSPYYKHAIVTSASFYSISGSSIEIHDLGRTEYTPQSQSTYILSINNPDNEVSESFGKSVSINNSWAVVGSPYVSSSTGMIYIYKNVSTGSDYSWSLHQKLDGYISGGLFGWDLKLNKASGNYSHSLVVGCGNLSSSKAYYFEFDNDNNEWNMEYEFNPTDDIYPLTFGNYLPYNTTMSVDSGYGYAVSIHGSTVVIGAPLDRSVYEYSGSSLYKQGAVYVYEKCPTISQSLFELSLKTYGTSSILKNNLLGYSVDVYDNYAVAGIPKLEYINASYYKSICYAEGTIFQTTNCETTDEQGISGQMLLLTKNTSSGDWAVKNLYQKKKKYLTPYRSYGFDVSIADRSLVVGAPLLLTGSESQINIEYTKNGELVLDDIMGKAYIYNLANLKNTFHIGNVFYRNGQIVVMTSGSIFDGIFYDPMDIDYYKYYLEFKGKHTIFEKQIVCTVDPGEFNVSTNPSAIIKHTGSLDINNNGIFDFQDIDIILRYMNYNISNNITSEWSSSILSTDDEISLYNYYIDKNEYNINDTLEFVSQSILNWKDSSNMLQILDFNKDNKIDYYDMNILWKYFSNRLTQQNYTKYITPSCERKLFSDIITYMDMISQKKAIPYINSNFTNYESLTLMDRTGSFLAPYVTTIGLYSGLDLVAVAKLGTPIKITPELPINFIIKMDW